MRTGQGVDEHADDTIGPSAALHATEENGAEDDGGFAGDVRENGGPGKVEQAGGGDAEGARMFADLAGEGGIQGQRAFFDGGTAGLRVGRPKGAVGSSISREKVLEESSWAWRVSLPERVCAMKLR